MKDETSSGGEVELIEVPYDSGHRGRRMGAGPGHLARSGLRSRIESAGFRPRERRIEASGEFLAENATTFELARRISSEVRGAEEQGRFPLVLSGNCGSSLGTVAGLSHRSVGVVWLDAHGDFNTPETTTSGFLDGMALSMLVGHCWSRLCASIPGFTPVRERAVLLVGARDLDPAESARLEASDVTVLPPGEPGEGESDRLDAAVSAVAREAAAIYLHVDLDALDPEIAPANMFPAPGGLSVDAARRVIRAVAGASNLAAAAFTSYAPDGDPENAVVDAAGDLTEEILDAVRPGG